MQISDDAEHLSLRGTSPRHAPSEHDVAERAAEVLGDLERCMNQMHARVSPGRLADAADRIARHELGARGRVGWWPR